MLICSLLRRIMLKMNKLNVIGKSRCWRVRLGVVFPVSVFHSVFVIVMVSIFNIYVLGVIWL